MDQAIKTREQALYLVNTLDSRHQGIQPTLRKFVRGEPVTDAELDQLESPFKPVADILKQIRDSKVTKGLRYFIDTLDTRNEVLRPLLHGLANGLE